jgi:pimeloyl-ACP methyl ester carboxylesterase
MGADARVFAPQKEEFPHLVVPHWIDPERGESLPEYAGRLAKEIDPGVPCIIGGASFGGMIAVEMIPHLQVRACILIGSAPHPDQLPPIVPLVRPFAKITALIPYGWIQRLAGLFLRIFGSGLSIHARTILSQAGRSESSFFRWAVKALLTWKGGGNVTGEPIRHIHGAKDPLLPLRYVNPDEIVEGGGHVISLRNSPQVNRFIRKVLEDL